MQKKLLIIAILIAFFPFSAWTSSLPPLPPTEAAIDEAEAQGSTGSAGSVSGWQKIKNFFGLGSETQPKAAEAKKLEQQESSGAEPKTIATSEEESNKTSQGITENKPSENKELPADDQIDDDFFKNIEKQMNAEEGPGVSLPAALGKHDDLQPTDAPHPAEPTAAASHDVSGEPPIAAKNGADESFESLPHETSVLDGEHIPLNPATENVPQDKQTISDSTKVNLPDIPADIAKEVTPPTIHEDTSKPATDPKSLAISRFKEEIGSKSTKRVDNLPIIPDSNPTGESELITDAKQLKFIADEAKVFIMANDDVVLGEVTEEALLELMDFSSYVKVFWENYDRVRRSDQRQLIADFIDNYDENFNKVGLPVDDWAEKLDEAFAAIGKQDINKLITLVNFYPVLHMKDKKQNSVMHQAAYAGYYPAARFLVMRGVDLNARNMKGETPLSIAQKYRNYYIIYLLNEAGLMPG